MNGSDSIRIASSGLKSRMVETNARAGVPFEDIRALFISVCARKDPGHPRRLTLRNAVFPTVIVAIIAFYKGRRPLLIARPLGMTSRDFDFSFPLAPTNFRLPSGIGNRLGVDPLNSDETEIFRVLIEGVPTRLWVKEDTLFDHRLGG